MQIAPSLTLVALFWLSPWSFASALASQTPITPVPTPTPIHTSVQVLSDRLVPLGGVAVSLDDGANSRVVATSRLGQTPWVDVDPSLGAQLILGDTVVDEGIALGFERFMTTDLSSYSGDVHLKEISITQPLARTVLLQGEQGHSALVWPPQGGAPLWVLSAPVDSSVSFGANVASLMDDVAIQGYLSYRGYSGSTPPYVRGVALVVPEISLGEEGIVVAFDLLGDVAPYDVVVDTYQFLTSQGLVGPIPPEPTDPLVTQVVEVMDDFVFVHISGDLHAGHLGLFARHASFGGPAHHVQPDSPPVLVPSGGGTDYVRRDGLPEDEVADAGDEERVTAALLEPACGCLVTDCEPPVPQMPANWECTPPVVTGNHCGAATAGQKECKTVRMRSPRVCRSAGSSFGLTKSRTSSWRVSFELNGGGSGALTTGSGFEYGKEEEEVTTDGWTADGGGAGLGECMRWFRFELICAQRYDRQIDEWDWYFTISEGFYIVVRYCAGNQTIYTACTDEATSQSECYRTQ
jgi:hypothetical protein